MCASLSSLRESLAAFGWNEQYMCQFGESTLDGARIYVRPTTRASGCVLEDAFRAATASATSTLRTVSVWHHA